MENTKMIIEFAEHKSSKVIPWEDKFELYRELDDDCWFISKEVFKHEEDGLNFEYRYLIQICDFKNITGNDDANNAIVLTMEICGNSLHEDTRDNILCFNCDGEIYPTDVAEYGLGIDMLSETINIDNIPWLEQEQIIDRLNAIASILTMVDSLRGFYLDRAWNRIGTTGWDSVRECVLGIDRFRASMDRYRVL